jgi:hypothetical protein
MASLTYFTRQDRAVIEISPGTTEADRAAGDWEEPGDRRSKIAARVSSAVALLSLLATFGGAAGILLMPNGPAHFWHLLVLIGGIGTSWRDLIPSPDGF